MSESNKKNTPLFISKDANSFTFFPDIIYSNLFVHVNINSLSAYLYSKAEPDIGPYSILSRRRQSSLLNSCNGTYSIVNTNSYNN